MPTAASAGPPRKLKIITDTVGTFMYVGEAIPGTAESAADWRIARIETVGGDVEKLWANGNTNQTNIWDDRESLSYS